MQSEEDYWQRQVEKLWPEVLLTADDGIRLNITRINETHPALQVRLLREGLRQIRGDLGGIEAVHLESLLMLTGQGKPQAELDLPGCWVARRYDQLWLRTLPATVAGFDLPLEAGASQTLPDGRILSVELLESSRGEDPCRVEFDAELVGFPLRVRSPLAGDRFRPSGMSGQRKIKDILVDLKVEKEQRRSLPLLVGQDEILWLAGLRRSVHAPVTEASRKILAVQLLKAR